MKPGSVPNSAWQEKSCGRCGRKLDRRFQRSSQAGSGTVVVASSARPLSCQTALWADFWLPGGDGLSSRTSIHLKCGGDGSPVLPLPRFCLTGIPPPSPWAVPSAECGRSKVPERRVPPGSTGRPPRDQGAARVGDHAEIKLSPPSSCHQLDRCSPPQRSCWPHRSSLRHSLEGCGQRSSGSPPARQRIPGLGCHGTPSSGLSH